MKLIAGFGLRPLSLAVAALASLGIGRAEAQGATAPRISGPIVVCATCHREPYSFGPNGDLSKVIGARAGTVAQKPTPALQNLDVIWNRDTLVAFLTAPKAFAPNTRNAPQHTVKPERVAELVSQIEQVNRSQTMWARPKAAVSQPAGPTTLAPGVTAESYARSCSVCHSPSKALDQTNAGRIEYMYGSRAGTVVWSPSDKLKSLDLVWDRKNLEAMMRSPKDYMISNPALRHSVPEQMIGPLIDYLAATRTQPPVSEQAARAEFDKWRSRAGVGAPPVQSSTPRTTAPARTPGGSRKGELAVEEAPPLTQPAGTSAEMIVRSSCAYCHSARDAIFFESLHGAKAGANTQKPSPELAGSGIVWTESTLAQFLTEPKGTVPKQFEASHRKGAAFAKDIAAYLKSISSKPGSP